MKNYDESEMIAYLHHKASRLLMVASIGIAWLVCLTYIMVHSTGLK